MMDVIVFVITFFILSDRVSEIRNNNPSSIQATLYSCRKTKLTPSYKRCVATLTTIEFLLGKLAGNAIFRVREFQRIVKSIQDDNVVQILSFNKLIGRLSIKQMPRTFLDLIPRSRG